MRILFVIPTLGTGGAERVVSILANRFSIENDVEIFVLEQSNVARYPIDDKVVVKELSIAVKRGNKIRAILNYVSSFSKQRAALKSEIHRFLPDAIISFLPKADMLTYTVVNNGIRTWIPSERNDPMARSNVERYILNHIYKRSSMLVCQTKKVAEYYRDAGVLRTCVIRNPLVIHPESKTDIAQPEHFFVAAGRLDRQKNFSMLIEAFSAALNETACSDRLLILGDGPEKQYLCDLISHLKMENQIMLLGRKNNVSAYFKEAKAFILSSDFEGLPNVMLEAMSVGAPIISTDFFTGAAREFIGQENGLLVPVGDKTAMTEAIKRIMLMPENKLKSMGEASICKVRGMDDKSISTEWAELVATIKKEGK